MNPIRPVPKMIGASPLMLEYQEEDHPRDEGGQWTEGGNGGVPGGEGEISPAKIEIREDDGRDTRKDIQVVQKVLDSVTDGDLRSFRISRPSGQAAMRPAGNNLPEIQSKKPLSPEVTKLLDDAEGGSLPAFQDLFGVFDTGGSGIYLDLETESKVIAAAVRAAADVGHDFALSRFSNYAEDLVQEVKSVRTAKALADEASETGRTGTPDPEGVESWVDEKWDKWADSKEMAGQSKEWMRDLSKTERSELEGYTDESYRDLVGQQRGTEPPTTSWRSMKHGYRAEVVEAAVKRGAQQLDKPVYRGMSMSKEDLAQLRVGGEMGLQSLSSMSTSEESAKLFTDYEKEPGHVSVLLVLDNPKSGAPMMGMSNLPDEKEVLFPSNVQMGISRIEERDGIQYVYMTEAA